MVLVFRIPSKWQLWEVPPDMAHTEEMKYP